ncbi:unnamed protein product [Rotaria sp. Silwood1]|nr:unnamed protein product [Rotaria sp. Silwood1]CAF1485678.1 unnamed protein product [Rotaria sp. Silwood1]
MEMNDTLEPSNPKYLEEKHPFGVIPVLTDDDFQIYESRAICRYLESKYKGSGAELIPTDIKALGLFEQAASIEAFNFDPYASGIIFERVFTLADLFHLPYGSLLVANGEGHFFESRPYVKAWWNRITLRPSWIAVKDLE